MREYPNYNKIKKKKVKRFLFNFMDYSPERSLMSGVILGVYGYSHTFPLKQKPSLQRLYVGHPEG
jgi:hypothetical protein